MIKFLLKCILFPVQLLLDMLIITLEILLGISKIILGLFAGFAILAAIIAWEFRATILFIPALLIAIFLSSLGVPLIGGIVVEILKGIKKGLKNL
jgi:hypothetical protein